MSKQTAVEWLQHQIYLRGPVGVGPSDMPIWLKDLFDQAKAMEKEQICNAMDVGFDEGGKFIEDIKYNNAEDYYNKTYKDRYYEPGVQAFCYHKGSYTTIKDTNGDEVCGKCRLPIAEEDKQ